MRKIRPTIKDLQDFTKGYFPSRCPVLSWKRMGVTRGEADRAANKIYLNPAIKRLRASIYLEGRLDYHSNERVLLKEGEQYFVTLLHEIAHFKIRKKPPAEWVRLKRKLLREAKIDLRNRKINNKRAGKRPMTGREEKDLISNTCQVCMQTLLKRKVGEREGDYQSRVQDFWCWFKGDMVSEHLSVEDWAWKEFKAQRKEIRKILTHGDLG